MDDLSFDSLFPAPGREERFVPSDVNEWDARKVQRVVDGVILFGNEDRARVSASPDDRLLWSFVELSDAPDAAVVAFAKKWGPLELCVPHGLPYQHGSAGYANFGDTCTPGLREPIDAWRRTAQQIRALLTAVVLIRKKQLVPLAVWKEMRFVAEPGIPMTPITPADGGSPASSPWEKALEKASRRFFREEVPSVVRRRLDENWADVVSAWDAFYRRNYFDEILSEQRSTVTRFVNVLLRWARLGLELAWGDDGPRFAYRFGDGQSLAATLFFHVALAAGRTEDLFICSECGSPYIRGLRPPRKNQRNYCEACREDGAPQRHAERTYARRRQKSRRSGRRQ